MTGSAPSLRPLLASILPEFFRSSYYTNISTLFNTEKRATMMKPWGSHSGRDNTSPGDESGNADSRRPMSSSMESLKESSAEMGMGEILITKEYYIEATQRPLRPGTSWPGVRPMTPSSKFAPRAFVTCAKTQGA